MVAIGDGWIPAMRVNTYRILSILIHYFEPHLQDASGNPQSTKLPRKDTLNIFDKNTKAFDVGQSIARDFRLGWDDAYSGLRTLIFSKKGAITDCSLVILERCSHYALISLIQPSTVPRVVSTQPTLTSIPRAFGPYSRAVRATRTSSFVLGVLGTTIGKAVRTGTTTMMPVCEQRLRCAWST